jgi:hypothetical protein
MPAAALADQSIIFNFIHFQHRPASGLQEQTPLKQHLSAQKQLCTLSLRINIHRTHTCICAQTKPSLEYHDGLAD